MICKKLSFLNLYKNERMKKLYPLLLFLLLIALSCSQRSEKTVMIITSYHPGYEWQAEEDSGLMSVLGKYGYVIERFDLDTKRNPGEEWKKQMAAGAIRKIGEVNPDLILVCDDNACKLVATQFIGSDMPVVFCGMNADPGEYGFPARNVTGVIEREFWKESVEYIRELKPDISRVVVMLDSSETALESAKRIHQLALPEIDEVFLTNHYDRWKDKILSLQGSSSAIGLFVHSTLTDSVHQGSVDPDEVLKWIVANSRIPEFGTMGFTVRNGALCGYCESGYEQGKLAAEMAVRILQGTPPDQIPITSPPEGKRMLNGERAAQLGIL